LALLDALEYCISDPSTVSALLKCFRVILQLATEQTLASFESLDVITRVLKAACHQAQELRNFNNFLCSNVMITEDSSQFKSIEDRAENALVCTELALSLFTEYVTISIDGRILVLQNAECIECLFDLFQEQKLRKHVLEEVLALFKVRLHSSVFKKDYVYLNSPPVLLLILGAKPWFPVTSCLHRLRKIIQQSCSYAPNI
jgi:hypothetical protein